MRTSEIAQELLEEFLAKDRQRLQQDVQTQVREDPNSAHYEGIPQALPPRAGGVNINVEAGQTCPNWLFAVTEGGVVVNSPGVVGTFTPTFDSVPLTDDPPPVISIPSSEGAYLIYFKMVWDPDVTEVYTDEWLLGSGGYLVDVEIVVAAEGAPPTDQEAQVNTSTGEINFQGVEHIVVARVQRGEAPDEETEGNLVITNNYLCYSLEWKICNRRMLLGQK